MTTTIKAGQASTRAIRNTLAIDPVTVIEEALDALGIAGTHTPEALAEAEDIAARGIVRRDEDCDWRTLPFVTIDNPDSRDLDQALLIEENGESGYRLRYALADPSAYLSRQGLLYQQALQRGSSYYTPLGSVPMLPRSLSEGLISLNPDVERRALVFDMQLDTGAGVLSTRIVPARIRSQARLSYAGVQAMLENDFAEEPAAPWHDSLRLLLELGEKLLSEATERGVVPFNRNEVEITIDGDPPRLSARRRQRQACERYNEQISLLCNVEGARLQMLLSDQDPLMHPIYRIHEAPLKERRAHLREVLDALAERYPEWPALRWQPQQRLADYLATLPEEASFQRLRLAIEQQILLSQRASRFSGTPGRHHALRTEAYARFTAPMREVVGIYSHAELLAALRRQGDIARPLTVETQADADDTERQLTIEAANTSRSTQRQLEKRIELATLATLFLDELEHTPPPLHHGTIVGFSDSRLYVSLDDLALDIKLYRNNLEQQFATDYTFSAIAATPADPAAPAWWLGDAIHLQVADFDPTTRRFSFALQAGDRADPSDCQPHR